ncbi:RNA polymerase sigma factor [Streptomyces sp. NBC_00057]|uniref:RNA polymerase sigma factor n=1 Tax=Streptomyces sp. NBC_00057 TaxID=2975634 RepID=UPI003245976B
MGRPEKDIPYPNSALGKLATHLRLQRARMGLAYSQLEALTQVNASNLSRAANGITLPTLEVVLAYDHACGGGTGNVRELWEMAQAEKRRRTHGPTVSAPRLDLVRDRADLSAVLVRAYKQCGSPSMRVMEQRANTRGREFGPLSRSSAHRIVNRQTVPTTLHQLHSFLHACGIPDAEFAPWTQAWKRAQGQQHVERSEKKAPASPLRQVTLKPIDMMRSAGFSPEEDYRSFTRPWTCRCLLCRAIVRVRLSDASEGNARCPVCSRDGSTQTARSHDVVGRRLPAATAADDFTLFFTAHKQNFMRIAVARLRNLHDADEALMDAAIKMHFNWHRIRSHGNPIALAYAILNSATTDFYRRRARHAAREIPVSGMSPTTYTAMPPVDAVHNFDGLERALAGLEGRWPLQAACIRLNYLADKNLTEIAAYLDITEGAAKTNIHLGLRTLRALMDLPRPGASRFKDQS